MEKKLLVLFIVPVMLTLASCGKKENKSSSDHSSSDEEQIAVSEFKDLLSKQDVSPFHEKSFASIFEQDYSVTSTSLSDGKEIGHIKYKGIGMYGFFYSVSENDYKEIMSKDDANPFDFITRSNMSEYELLQQATFDSFQSQTEDEIESKTSLKYNQHLQGLSKDNTFQLFNEFSLSDLLDESKNETRKFNTILEKELLLDSISTASLSDLFQRITIFDGQRNSEFLDTLYYATVQDLMNKSDLELSNFIQNNHIEINKGEEYIEVSFKIEDENIQETLSENDVFPGIISGTLYYDKEDGSFQNHEYEISYVENRVSEDNSSAYSASMTFKVDKSSFSYHSTFGREPYITPDPIVYTDGNEFVKDMIKEIIPPIQ